MEPNNEITEPIKKDNKNKSNAATYVIMGIIVLMVIGYLLAKGKKQNENVTLNNGVVTTEQEAVKKGDNLSDGERKLQEERAVEAENEIKAFTDKTTADERYKSYIKLAGAKYRLGDYEAGIAALDKIKDENSSKGRVWSQYTLIYKDKGDLDKARESLAKALALDPTNPQNLLLNVELAADQSPENLDKLYNDALQKSDNYIDVVVSYAQFLEQKSDKPKAIGYWEKAAQINPSDKAYYDEQVARIKK